MTANNICQRTDTDLFGSNIATKKNDNYKNMLLLLTLIDFIKPVLF